VTSFGNGRVHSPLRVLPHSWAPGRVGALRAVMISLCELDVRMAGAWSRFPRRESDFPMPLPLGPWRGAVLRTQPFVEKEFSRACACAWRGVRLLTALDMGPGFIRGIFLGGMTGCLLSWFTMA
jgi:hypothetical protein